MTPYQKHKKIWSNCKRCNLYLYRTNIVLARGRIPCKVVFVGEAPGVSEDVLGRPFVGPAGKLLDRIIEKLPSSCSYALTNLVACIPKDSNGSKAEEPPEECIKACARRLGRFVGLCRPRLVVCVGKLAKKWAPKILGSTTECITIIHPAAILRMDISQRGLAIQRSMITLIDAVDDL